MQFDTAPSLACRMKARGVLLQSGLLTVEVESKVA